MECKIDLAALMREEGLPLYVYADGTVTHKMVPGKIKIGKIWGCLEGVEPKEKLRSREEAFSRPFTEEQAEEQDKEYGTVEEDSAKNGIDFKKKRTVKGRVGGVSAQIGYNVGCITGTLYQLLRLKQKEVSKTMGMNITKALEESLNKAEAELKRVEDKFAKI